MAMKIKVGQTVRGKDFFPREKEILRLWKKIENGNNILISAPRRVGKTSLMRFLQDNPKENFLIIYLITESVSNENEYYKRLYKNLLEEDVVNWFTRIGAVSKNVLNKISEIGKSLKIEGNRNLDYYSEFIILIKSLKLESNRLIIMIDEFPQTLENIINEQGNNAAYHFLQTNRELRQSPEISEKVQFIYTGSIGLENIVSRINSVNLINDLDVFHLQPLKETEARDLINELVLNLKFTLESVIIDKILSEIKWHIPYYIQIVIQEIDNIYDEKDLTIIDESIVDLAFKQLLEQRIYFEHWYKRLEKAYKSNEYKFARDLLNSISTNDNISVNEVLNLATGLNIQDKYKEIVNALIHDGYINVDSNNYRFNSPLLKLWWEKNVAG